MRLRKLNLTIMVFAAVFLIGSVASAENWSWYECDVVKMGMSTRYEFQLSGTKMYSSMPGPATINKWFEIHPASVSCKKEVLAVVLTAISLGKKVEILVDPDVTKSIYAIYMK